MEVIRGHLGCPLSGGCPLFGGSAIGGSTVYIYIYLIIHINVRTHNYIQSNVHSMKFKYPNNTIVHLRSVDPQKNCRNYLITRSILNFPIPH